MKRKVLLVVAAVTLLFTGAALAGCSESYILPDTQNDGSGFIWSQQNIGIWVSGLGTVTVVPDVAVLTLGVETQATTIAQAQEQAASAMDAVMAELDDWGIAEEDIKTQYYNIYPVRRWDNGQEILIGYRVTNMVTVKIREVDNTGAIIDDAVRAGGDAIRINSIAFTVDDPSAYYDEARGKAMTDAEAKAQQMADLAGVTLGKPTYISEGGGYIPVPYYDTYKVTAEAGSVPTTPISAGETEIRLSVQVVYSIK